MRVGFLSGLGLITALAASIALGATAFATGGEIFSPGGLNGMAASGLIGGVASHSDLSCSGCHTPFWGPERMGDRCLDCHQSIQEELSTTESLHGELADATNCRNCHTEHHGANSTLTLYDSELYPHAEFGFYLISHRSLSDGRPFECSNCHMGSLRAFDVGTCGSCHLEMDQEFLSSHLLDFDTSCLDCHDGIDRYDASFDHQATAFPLSGVHQDLHCSGCHEGARSPADLENTNSECIACHQQDDVHEASLGTDCGACHSSLDWQVAQFDHSVTGFPLVDSHESISCVECHASGFEEPVNASCISCHLEDDVHNGQLGTDCVACHSAVSWNQVLQEDFDHNLTSYPLTGQHATLATCEGCHSGGQLKGTPTQCIACHGGDDIHNGHFGDSCSRCHTTSGWAQNSFDHNQTRFKLTGAHSLVGCTDCHSNGMTVSLSPSCVSCHRGDDVHDGDFGNNCTACHSTVTWQGVDFDHSQTGFPLTGQHGSATCQQCHGDGEFAGTPSSCVGCHLDDDTHNGDFGMNCAACHTTGGWGGADFDHSQTGFPLTGQHGSATCQQCHDSGYSGTPSTCISCHQGDDAHDGANGTNCQACHSTSGWGGVNFDHSQTDFPLTGSHQQANCTSCHQNGQYAGTPSSCSSCHGEPDYHAGLFGLACGSCHSTDAWRPASYDRSHTFPLRHGDSRGVCSDCHTNQLPNHECTKCHDPNRLEERHAEENITDLSNCLQCHPDGNKD